MQDPAPPTGLEQRGHLGQLRDTQTRRGTSALPAHAHEASKGAAELGAALKPRVIPGLLGCVEFGRQFDLTPFEASVGALQRPASAADHERVRSGQQCAIDASLGATRRDRAVERNAHANERFSARHPTAERATR